MLMDYLKAYRFIGCKFSFNTVGINLNRHAVVFLVALSILWNYSSCRVVRMADSLQHDDRTWWKNFPRRKPLDLYGIFKLRESIYSKNRLQKRSLLDPDEDKNLLKAPDPGIQKYDWWWITTSTATTPFNFDNIKVSKVDDLALYSILFVMVAAIIIIICKYLMCEEKECTFMQCKECCDITLDEIVTTSRRAPRTTLNPPRRFERNSRSRAPMNTYQNYSFTSESQTSSSRPHVSLVASPQSENQFSSARYSSNTNSALDKPPGYSDVVLADFSAGTTQFPGVKPTAPESPPPNYDEKIMKY